MQDFVYVAVRARNGSGSGSTVGSNGVRIESANLAASVGWECGCSGTGAFSLALLALAGWRGLRQRAVDSTIP